jgi:hypothetical protein
MRNYIFDYYVGDREGFIGQFLEWYWDNKLDKMSEGQIMKLYYQLTNRKGVVDYE